MTSIRSAITRPALSAGTTNAEMPFAPVPLPVRANTQ